MPAKGDRNNPHGAPVKQEVDEKFIREAARLYGLGLKQEDVAMRMGVSLATLKRYMTKHPNLKIDMFKSQGELKEMLAKSMWQQALHDPDCPPAIRIYLSKVFLWKPEPKEVKVTHDLKNLIVESMKISEQEALGDGDGDEDSTIIDAETT